MVFVKVEIFMYWLWLSFLYRSTLLFYFVAVRSVINDDDLVEKNLLSISEGNIALITSV